MSEDLRPVSNAAQQLQITFGATTDIAPRRKRVISAKKKKKKKVNRMMNIQESSITLEEK
jgi:hypothetical protein